MELDDMVDDVRRESQKVKKIPGIQEGEKS